MLIAGLLVLRRPQLLAQQLLPNCLPEPPRRLRHHGAEHHHRRVRDGRNQRQRECLVQRREGRHAAGTADALRLLERVRCRGGGLLRQGSSAVESEYHERDKHALQQYLQQRYGGECAVWAELGSEYRWIW